MSRTIIKKIKSTISKFIWNGGMGGGKYHLASWDNITMPKQWGWWGLLDTDTFRRALILKSIWRCTQFPGIWSDIIRYNYLENKILETIFIMGWETKRECSAIWNSLRRNWSLYISSLKWKFGNGKKIMIGEGGIWGFPGYNIIDLDLCNRINGMSIFYFCQAINSWQMGCLRWREA